MYFDSRLECSQIVWSSDMCISTKRRPWLNDMEVGLARKRLCFSSCLWYFLWTYRGEVWWIILFWAGQCKNTNNYILRRGKILLWYYYHSRRCIIFLWIL